MSAEQALSQAVPDKKTRAASAAGAIQILPDLVGALLHGSESSRQAELARLADKLRPQYPAVSKRIERMIPRTMTPLTTLPTDLIRAFAPRINLDQVVAEPSVRASLDSLVVEHSRAEELARFSLSPRHKILLVGPPGNGKTTISEALATALQLPYLCVSYAGLVDSHLGGTGRNAEKIFAYANAYPCLLFFDEFDSIAKTRSAQGDVGEARRITNQLMLLMDRLAPHCVFVAATNAGDSIDSALLRRFDMTIQISAPAADLRLECARRQLATDLTPGANLGEYAEQVAALGHASLSDVTELCRRIRRDYVLNHGAGIQALLVPAVSKASPHNDGE